MKKTLKKSLSILLAITIIFSSAYVGLSEVDFSRIDFGKIDFSGLFAVKAKAASSGTCGTNLTWTLDDEGTLTISGTGAMKHYYEYFEVPWCYSRYHITTVVIETGVTSIGTYAFYECESLTSVTIGNSVTSIDEWAFDNCTSLTSITIPDSVTSIGSSAFDNCTSLTSIIVDADNTAYSSVDGVLFNKDKTTLTRYPAGRTNTCYTIPDSVTSIGDRAFYVCTSLTSITIPDSVTSIGEWAFYKTAYYNNDSNWENNVLYIGNHLIKAETSITGAYEIKNGTKTIAKSAFYNCDSLTSITIPDSVTSIRSYAFYECESLTSVTIGNSVTSIGEKAFYNCDSLTSITIPDSVTSIGNRAFAECYDITSITIPDSVTSIGIYAFNGCDNLKNVYINDISAWCSINFSNDRSNPLYYADKLYVNGELVTDVVIPDGVTIIPMYAFNCNNLVSITIPDSVTSIGDYAFTYCRSLTAVTIGDGVTSIGEYAFRDCTSLTSVTIGNSVTSIGDRAFYECTSLTSVTIGNSVTSIGDYAFYYCESLTSITIPDSVTRIGSWAFYYCTSLTSITIPDSVTSIGDFAFYYCPYFKNVYINDISAWCGINFSNNSSNPLYYADKLYVNGELVTDVVIPSGVTSIGKYAFYGCTILTSITIPDSVTSIGDYAFYNCTNLTDVYYLGLLSDWDKISIGSNNGCLTNANISHLCTYGDWVVNTEPTCTEDGLRSKTCIVCGEGETETITATGHNYSTEWTIDQAATCTDAGSKSHHCTVCGNKADVTIIPTTGHNYGDWVVTQEPICTEEGSHSKTCSACGDVVTESMAIIDHNYSSEWTIDVEATCTTEGSKSHHCTVCNDKADITVIEAIGHNYVVQSTETTHPHTTIYTCIFCENIKTEKVYISDCVECNFHVSAVDSSSYKLVSYIGTETDVVIPSEYKGCAITTIANACFRNNKTIKSVKIPDSVTSIGSLAFMNCTSLEKVYIPSSVTSIGSQAFYGFKGTIYCTNGSTAHNYAVTNNIPFVLLCVTGVGDTEIDYENFVIRTSVQNCSDITKILWLSDSVEIIPLSSCTYDNLEVYGTGTVCVVFDGNEYIGDFTLVVNGDTNGDSVCDALDAAQVALASNGHENLDGAYAMAADSNSDDIVDINDYQQIVNKAVS